MTTPSELGSHCTWQSLSPFDSRDDLPPSQAVEGCHETGGGVGQGAVVAGIDGLRLDGLEQRQHGGDELWHGLGDKGPNLGRRGRGQLRLVALLDAL